jgi:hypothetical protein
LGHQPAELRALHSGLDEDRICDLVTLHVLHSSRGTDQLSTQPVESIFRPANLQEQGQLVTAERERLGQVAPQLPTRRAQFLGRFGNAVGIVQLGRTRDQVRGVRAGRVAEPRRRPCTSSLAGPHGPNPPGARSACSGLGRPMLGLLTPFGEVSLVQVHLVPPLPTGEITVARRL